MLVVDRLVIVGVGLIGGSIGKAALARSAAREVIGVGRNSRTLDDAVQCGAITSGTTDIASACRSADLVIVCTPVDTIASFVQQAAAACKKPALISDAGSTKARIVADTPATFPGEVRFLGAHPLAGSEKGGVAHARADMFTGRTTVITPSDATAAADVSLLQQFWEALGAVVRMMTPAEHDRAVAATSHVPHLAAAALAASTAEQYLPLTSTGWLDTTRVAAMEASIWGPIFASNRDCVLHGLDAFEATLRRLRAAIETNDAAALEQLLATSRARRTAAQNTP